MRNPVNDAACDLLSGFFATFAHRTRMRILCALQHKPRTVTEIAESAGIAIANASQHLRILREQGAVVAEKHAQSVSYRVADPRMLEAVRLIRDALSERLRAEADRANPRGARKASGKSMQAA